MSKKTTLIKPTKYNFFMSALTTSIFLVLIAAQQLTAQSQVSGTVKDDDGLPLPGATIIEEGTDNGTTSDFDGNFTFTLENDESSIVISYIGYITKTFSVADGSIVDVSLSIDSGSLDEVVVTGFGTSQQKKLITGSIATISSDLIENRGLTSAGLALAGTTPGVLVTQNSGQAGRDDVQFRVRGYGTVNDATPLIIIDGIEDVKGNEISLLDLRKLENRISDYFIMIDLRGNNFIYKNHNYRDIFKDVNTKT